MILPLTLTLLVLLIAVQARVLWVGLRRNQQLDQDNQRLRYQIDLQAQIICGAAFDWGRERAETSAHIVWVCQRAARDAARAFADRIRSRR